MKFIIAGISALMLLSGCASSFQQADISDVKAIPADHGFVAVSVVNNVEILAPLHPNWSEVWIVRTDNRAEKQAAAIAKARSKGVTKPDEEIDYSLDIFTLTPIAAGAITSQSFLGSMPAGEYRIGMLYSFYSDGNMSSSLTMPVGISTGSFKVETNTLTNLGSIVFQPLLNVSSPTFWTSTGTQSAYVTRGRELTDLRRFALETYPNLASRLTVAGELSWNDSDPQVDQLRQDLYQLTRENGFSDIAHKLTKYGTGAVTGRFGLLHYVDQQGQWHTESLPTDGQLAALLELDSEVIVGGEFGALYAAPSLAGPWQPIEAVNTRESIVFLGAGKTTQYAVTQSAETFYVYRFDDIRSNWQRVHSIQRKTWAWTGRDEIIPMLTEQGGLRILVASRAHTIHPDTHAVSITSAAEHVVNLAALGNGTVVALEHSLWDGVGDQVVSVDDTASWQVFERRLRLWGDQQADTSLPTRLADGRFVTLGRDGNASTNSDKMHIVTSSHANVSNRDLHEFHGATQPYCETLLPQLTHENSLYFLCDQGSIMRTDDLGQSYQTLAEVDIAAMQRQFRALLEQLVSEE